MFRYFMMAFVLLLASKFGTSLPINPVRMPFLTFQVTVRVLKFRRCNNTERFPNWLTFVHSRFLLAE